MKNCEELTKCLCCDGDNLTQVLDLKDQPLANSYTRSKLEEEEFFPLGLNYCNDCTHLQLTHAVNPDLLFKNYLYVSGTTKTLKQYFDDFVSLVGENSQPTSAISTLSVLDIACNDGTQLDSFKRYGYDTYGIDPAENLYALSSKNHKVVCDYLSEDSIQKLGKDTFNVIIAQNVFAHNTYPKKFLEICKKHLAKNGRIFIQTSQADMVKHGQFDTIYHEHISFFNIRSIGRLAESIGLYMTNVIRTDIHGTSEVYVFSENPEESISSEAVYSMHLWTHGQDKNAVDSFSKKATSTIRKLKAEIAKYKQDGYMIVGYGAAAKGNTILNFGDIQLDYIVDDNPLKHNLFTPGTKIPIVPFDHINSINRTEEIVWLPLAWNFFSEIKQNIKSKRPELKDKFIQLDFATV
jgi:2-polyprenyl-3-methyl-5-hydroxy-6-metoxy-1,4-benzoquinol methylase